MTANPNNRVTSIGAVPVRDVEAAPQATEIGLPRLKVVVVVIEVPMVRKVPVGMVPIGLAIVLPIVAVIVAVVMAGVIPAIIMPLRLAIALVIALVVRPVIMAVGA